MFRGGEYFDNPQVNNLKKVISSVETVKNLLKEKQMKDLNKSVSAIVQIINRLLMLLKNIGSKKFWNFHKKKP